MTELPVRAGTLPGPTTADDRTAASPEPARAPLPAVRRPRRRLRTTLKHTGLVLAGFTMLYPLLWIVASSLKPNALIFREPGLIPSTVTLENYTLGWEALLHPFSHYLANSAGIVAGAALCNLVSGSLAAYAFARLNCRFRRL